MTGRKKPPPRLSLSENRTGRGLILVTLSLLAIGVVMVHSAVTTVSDPGPWFSRVDVRHGIYAAASLLVVLTLWRVDYRRLAAGERLPWAAMALMGAALTLSWLVFVPGLGHEVGGRWRWLRVPVGPGLTFQPSELVKLATIVLLAAWLSRPDVSPRSLTRGLAASVLVVLLAVAPVIQEDFGTALLIVVAAGSVMLLAGVPAWSLLLLAAGGAAAFYLLVSRDASRMARIHALFDPWSTTNPAAYQPRQSLIALLNGGWTGRGLGRGVTKLGFLPEDTTDFIFSVYVEETGLIGALLLLGLILAWIWHARRASVYAPDRFGMLLAGGVGVMVAVQALLHVAVDLVVLPPTGMGLPFVSAGGSAMVIMAAGVALTVAVTARSDPGGGGLR